MKTAVDDSGLETGLEECSSPDTYDGRRGFFGGKFLLFVFTSKKHYNTESHKHCHESRSFLYLKKLTSYSKKNDSSCKKTTNKLCLGEPSAFTKCT